MKVKVALKFRGREMAHTEIGFEVMKDFLAKIAPFGSPDFEPKLIGKGIHAMVSPLPRNKRAKNPYKTDENPAPDKNSKESAPQPSKQKIEVSTEPKAEFSHNPFAKLEVK